MSTCEGKMGESTVVEQQKAEVASNKNTKEACINPPAELSTKHPLQNTWALWFFKNDKTKSWAANLRLITKFQFVEDFWAIYNHIQVASKLGVGCDYSLFKDGIEPMWEDEQNRLGGRWLVNLNKQQRVADLDRMWLETLLCLIGEAFGEASDDVNGAVVNVRPKGDKLGLWTAHSSKTKMVMDIGKSYKERLTLPPKFQIVYESHVDTASKSGSSSKTKFTI